MRAWHLTDVGGFARVTPQQDSFDDSQQLQIRNVLARSVLPENYYWSAPSPYLGSKVSTGVFCRDINLVD